MTTECADQADWDPESREEVPLDHLLAFLSASDVRHERVRWLERKHYGDPTATDFLLNSRTRRLLPSEELTKSIGGRQPFVVAVALPNTPRRELLDPLQDKIWTWIGAQERRYKPYPSLPFPGGDPRPVWDGLFVGTPAHRSGQGLKGYLHVSREGIAELGLGELAWYKAREWPTFRFVPLVGLLWQFIGFVNDLYTSFGQAQPYTLGLGMRGIEGTDLGIFARGWSEPDHWPGDPPLCTEAALWYQRDDLDPRMSAGAVADLVRSFAAVIGNAWGHRVPPCFSPASVDPAESFDTQRHSPLRVG